MENMEEEQLGFLLTQEFRLVICVDLFPNGQIIKHNMENWK
jgi:hypothetical protein